MNLNDLYSTRDPRDAYQRDVDSSLSGMSQRSRADVTGEEEPSGVFTVVINGRPWKTGTSNKMFGLARRVANKHPDKKVAVKWPTGQLNIIEPQGVAEGDTIYENADVLAGLTDILKIAASRQAPQNPRYFAQQVKDVALQFKDNPATQKWSNYLDDVVRWADVIASGKEQYSPQFAGEVHSVLGPATRAYQDALLNKPGVAEGEADSDGYSVDHADVGEYDYEGDQAKDQLNTIVRAARRLNNMLDDNENMPEWVQMKITTAADYIDTAADYIESNQEPDLDEGEKVGHMDADRFDAAVERLKQLAGAGPMKTVWDPAKRVYRNVPVAVQPKK